MRPSHFIILLLITESFLASAQTDPVKKAKATNEKKADEKRVNQHLADFLVEAADGRMMDAKEGKLAMEKSTSPTLREYGQLMINDQSMLLAKIKGLATEQNISLPTGISHKKEEGREDLKKKSGKDFDEKFIKMMIIDHKRDVQLFRKATKSKDPIMSRFASNYLPLIQTHLDKIERLKKEYK